MSPLLFFIAGFPVAFALDRAILALSTPAPADDSADGPRPPAALEERALPWQVGPWPSRIRLAVVALAPGLMAIAGWRFDLAQALVVSSLLAALLICTGTDLIQFRVPNVVTYPGTALVLLAALVLPDGDVASGLVAAALFGGLALVASILTRGGLGLGDVKLAVLIGAGLGVSAAYQALVLGVLAGGVTILALFLLGVVSRKQAVPYAPFLALAAMAVVLARGAAFAPL